MELNEQQQWAVYAGDGPVVIIAGPGTGKTKTLTARIAYLVADRQVPASRILALTFTKKAAAEMDGRVAALLPKGSAQPTVTTFHALCYQILGGELVFASEPQRLQIIKTLPKSADFKALSSRELGLLISKAKNAPTIEDKAMVKLVRAYDKALQAQNMVDYDDLLLRTYTLLSTDAAARQTLQERYEHILVDEFQDTNRLQYELLLLLRGNDNLFVIGDPNQSIYGFRGASGAIFDQFQADFPACTTIVLTRNYRSVPEVVSLSNAVFTAGPQLQPHVTASGQVRAVQVLNEYSEAAWVLSQIQQAIGGGDFLQAVSNDDPAKHHSLGDFAVLYRSRSAATAMQKMFAESGLPFQVVGDGSPYDRPEVQAIIALCKAIAYNEPLELEGFSGTQRQALLELLQPSTQLVPSLLAERIISILGFEPSHELAQLVSTLVRFDTLPAALSYLEAIAEQGFYDPQADAITLMTIHASKGLEFPHVFVLGVEEGVLPSQRGVLDEERRLFYVAVTRARQRLEILHAKHRGGQPALPSSFITALPAEVLRRAADPDMQAQARRIALRAAKRSQQSLF